MYLYCCIFFKSGIVQVDVLLYVFLFVMFKDNF